MTPTTPQTTPTLQNNPEKAIILALTLAQAERAIHEFAAEQVDAIVDGDGKAYLLRPAQENLRHNDRRLQAIIDSAADVITVVSRSGVILSQSRAVQRVFGYGPEELVGKNIFELIYEEDLDRLYTAFFNVIEGFQESATAQFYHPVRDGFYRLIEATVGKVCEGFPASVVLILRPMAGSAQPHPEPATTDLSEADEDRKCILLSHGRRIPLRATGLGLDA